MRINIYILIVARMFMITLFQDFRIYRASKSNNTRRHYPRIHICIILEAFYLVANEVNYDIRIFQRYATLYADLLYAMW